MKIVGCDLHTRYQQIAMMDEETGELIERRLEHESGEARIFYATLTGSVRVGIEATGHTRWFERMLRELGHELWIGDAAQIRAAMVRKQKTDARDAAHLLDLLLNGRFPGIWRPTMAERDLRQLVWHRQKLVWMRVSVSNQLHALAMGEGICRKKKLWPALSASTFMFALPKLWVPRPCDFCKGGYDAADRKRFSSRKTGDIQGPITIFPKPFVLSHASVIPVLAAQDPAGPN